MLIRWCRGPVIRRLAWEGHLSFEHGDGINVSALLVTTTSPGDAIAQTRRSHSSAAKRMSSPGDGLERYTCQVLLALFRDQGRVPGPGP
jgi:hypothetical protein